MSDDMDDLIAFIEPENKPVSYPRIDKIPMVHPVYAIHEHEIKRWAYAFREQRDLLEECERQMKVLIANAEGCLMNHYYDDYALHGTPGWLLDCKATLTRLRGEK